MPSSVIASYQYDAVAHQLKVIFLSGVVYVYKDVPESVYAKMKNAISKGKFLNNYIKGKFEFTKLEQ